MAILTKSGRTVLSKLVMESPVHMAWGTGDPDWDSEPEPETIDEIALINEVGRRSVSTIRYCEPDENGSIIVPTGRFEESPVATNHLYMRFNFDFFDAPTASIREVAVFIGTELVPNLPGAQMYFEPADVDDPGILLIVERIARLDRSSSIRQSFEFVVTF